MAATSLGVYLRTNVWPGTDFGLTQYHFLRAQLNPSKRERQQIEGCWAVVGKSAGCPKRQIGGTCFLTSARSWEQQPFLVLAYQWLLMKDSFWQTRQTCFIDDGHPIQLFFYGRWHLLPSWPPMVGGHSFLTKSPPYDTAFLRMTLHFDLGHTQRGVSRRRWWPPLFWLPRGTLAPTSP